jgi:hypothetical protein
VCLERLRIQTRLRDFANVAVPGTNSKQNKKFSGEKSKKKSQLMKLDDDA